MVASFAPDMPAELGRHSSNWKLVAPSMAISWADGAVAMKVTMSHFALQQNLQNSPC